MISKLLKCALLVTCVSVAQAFPVQLSNQANQAVIFLEASFTGLEVRAASYSNQTVEMNATVGYEGELYGMRWSVMDATNTTVLALASTVYPVGRIKSMVVIYTGSGCQVNYVLWRSWTEYVEYFLYGFTLVATWEIFGLALRFLRKLGSSASGGEV